MITLISSPAAAQVDIDAANHKANEALQHAVKLAAAAKSAEARREEAVAKYMKMEVRRYVREWD